MFNNIDTSRSYATEAALLRALERCGLADCRPLVVCNRQGRFTAIIPVSAVAPNVGRAARLGFMTVG